MRLIIFAIDALAIFIFINLLATAYYKGRKDGKRGEKHE